MGNNEAIRMAIEALEEMMGLTRKYLAVQARGIIALAALRALPADDWRPIATAPKDQTRMLLWIVHPNARFDLLEYSGPAVGRWIKHNGGGLTWHGMSGDATHWRPLPAPPTEAK